MSGTPPPSLEDRILALEKAVAPAIAGATGKISTRVAGILTATVTAITWLLSGPLPDSYRVPLTLAAAGISAYVAAEET